MTPGSIVSRDQQRIHLFVSGTVYLVGAGPGDPRLITLRGAELLQQADVVLYDGLVNPLLLTLTQGRCERTARTRTGDHAIVPQDAINRQLIEEAQAGHCVVRLKGGDPYVFGRGSEEARALTEAGVPFEIVPGITAATAAGVYAGFSFTHRHHASAVAFVTGHETPERTSSQLDYPALARFPGTLVFYMGLARIDRICEQLIAAGKPADTPAAVVSRASLPEQRVVSAPLDQLADTVAASGLHAPSLIVVGECVRQRDAASWFESLPLFGLRIGITRPVHQSGEVTEAVVRAGGQPMLLPLIEIQPPDDEQRQVLTTAIEQLPDYDWLIFTSANGVQGFMNQLRQSGRDLRQLHPVQIAAVGSATATALEDWSLSADVVPETARSEELAAVLIPQVTGRRCLWPCADRARETLRQLLTDAGADLKQVVAYRHRDSPARDALRAQFVESPPHWIGLSSPAIARQAAEVFPELTEPGRITRIVSISRLTSTAARDTGLTVDAEATDTSWNSMLDAIAESESGRPSEPS